MAKIKLIKTTVGAARAGTQDIELRDTLVPGFLCKVTPVFKFRIAQGRR